MEQNHPITCTRQSHVVALLVHPPDLRRGGARRGHHREKDHIPFVALKQRRVPDENAVPCELGVGDMFKDQTTQHARLLDAEETDDTDRRAALAQLGPRT